MTECIPASLLNSVRRYVINKQATSSRCHLCYSEIGTVWSSHACVSGPQTVGAAAEHSRFGSGQRTWSFVSVQTGELDRSEETSAHHDLLGYRVRVLPPINPLRPVIDSSSYSVSHHSSSRVHMHYFFKKHPPIMHLSVNAKH